LGEGSVGVAVLAADDLPIASSNYLMDMGAGNSFVEYAVAQGFDVIEATPCRYARHKSD